MSGANQLGPRTPPSALVAYEEQHRAEDHAEGEGERAVRQAVAPQDRQEAVGGVPAGAGKGQGRGADGQQQLVLEALRGEEGADAVDGDRVDERADDGGAA